MTEQRWTIAIIISGLTVLVLLPVVLGGGGDTFSDDARTLVIVTPHNEQIRDEFSHAFARWHKDTYSEDVRIAWSVPGGTSEIRAMLESQWLASLDRGEMPGGFADLVFGGGSYEHGRLARGVELRLPDRSFHEVRVLADHWMGSDAADAFMTALVTPKMFKPPVAKMGHVTLSAVVDGDVVDVSLKAPLTVPGGFDPDTMAERFGRSTIGGVPLWDPEGHWVGTALSSFGLIANLDELKRLGIDPPESWRALADPRLQGMVSLVNPAQSGSVTTAFETLLGRLGWTRGWQVLRRAAANARTISASALRGPMDVAAGDAALGVCIDFFGRGEAQALADFGAPDRIIYVDPPGETAIDPDPVSMLADPPDAELARRFIAFTLTDAAQGLWQLAPGNGTNAPRRFSLRRIPITVSAWETMGNDFIDIDARPGDIDPPPFADRNTRAFIAPLLSAMALDDRAALADAWHRIVTHEAYPDTYLVVTADDVDDPELRAMLLAFDAMPHLPSPDGAMMDLARADHREAIKNGWLRDGWAGADLWSEQQRGIDAFRQTAGRFFRERYAQVRRGASP
jgi:ABC-type Fe3+ transport system substrate-binding protein